MALGRSISNNGQALLVDHTNDEVSNRSVTARARSLSFSCTLEEMTSRQEQKRELSSSSILTVGKFPMTTSDGSLQTKEDRIHYRLHQGMWQVQNAQKQWVPHQFPS